MSASISVTTRIHQLPYNTRPQQSLDFARRLAASDKRAFPCVLMGCKQPGPQACNRLYVHGLYLLEGNHPAAETQYQSEDGWLQLIESAEALERLAQGAQGDDLGDQEQTITLPTISALKTAIDIGMFAEYQTIWTANVEAIIREISKSPRIQRKRMGDLVSVYSYIDDVPGFIDRLNALALRYIDKLYARKTKNDVDCRTVDSLLHLAFELSSLQPVESTEQVLERLERDYVVTPFEMKMVCRGLRQSFLKGVEVGRRHPVLIDRIVSTTDSHDADAFKIFAFIVNKLHHHDTNDAERLHTLEKLFSLPKRDIISLVRDLRRTVPNKAPLPAEYNNYITNVLAAEIEQGELDGEVWIARLYAIIFTLGYNPTLLLWINQHAQQLGIASEHADALAAVCGYDTPYVLRRLLNLNAHRCQYPLLSTSGHDDIARYFESNLASWTDFQTNGVPAIDEACSVTVIFTTFNPDMRMLALSLQSICMQVQVRLDVILVDDASTTVSREDFELLVNAMHQRYGVPITYYRNPDNQGQYASRNFAIAQSRGDYIAIQDDDDISHPQRLYLQIAAMQETQVVASHAQHLRFSENARFMADGNFIGNLEGDGPVTFIWKRDVFRAIGGFVPTRTRGDIEFRRRLERTYGRKAIAVIDLPLVYMRGGLNTISSMKEYVHRSALSALRYMMDHTDTEQVDNPDFDCWIPFRLKHA